MEMGHNQIGSLERGHLRYLPVAAGRMEFAIEVRKAILTGEVQVVAVELPATLEAAYRRAVKLLPEISVIVYPEGAGSAEFDDDLGAIYVPVEPADPFAEAVRTAVELGLDLLFIEPDLGERPHLSDLYPDPYALRRVPYDKYVEAYRVHPQPRTDETAEHAAGMAWRLQGSDPGRKTLVVCSLNLLDALLDAMETPQEPPRERRHDAPIELVNAHPECLAEITVEMPYLQARYETYRMTMLEGEAIDRPRVQMALLRDAEAENLKNSGEKLAYWQRRMIARYTRNLALMSRDLTAGLFDLTVAARAVVDDNYAWEVWAMAGRYPYQREVTALDTVRVSGDEVWFRTKRIKLRRRFPRAKQRLKPGSLKMRKREKKPGEWAEQLDGSSICSYPPEDIVIEDYGAYLKQKAKMLMSQERERVEPFLNSMLDGIDIRETIRNWHQKRIYVKSAQRVAGEVGAVVVIFDVDFEDRYRYQTTWLGEHQNESDMAFYATDPFDHMVGPGIGRGEYGGLLMTRPPRRMMNVWGDPDYELAESKPERLLLAALDYATEKHVVYVAAKPPRSIFRSIAGHLGRKIVYVPIGQVSSDKLKRLRVVHVLDGHDKREIAKDYIW